MNQKIEDKDFVIFDVETTGLDPASGDRIVEIAAFRFKNSRAGDSFASLINPGRRISPGAFEVNHITQDMIDAAPEPAVVLPKFLDFVGNSCLAGYNVGFDLGFLENELKLLSQELSQGLEVIDVMQMARRILPDIGRYGLSSVASYLGVETPQEHRALSDVMLTASVFDKLLAQVRAKGIEDYLQFYNLFGFNLAVTADINNQHLASIQRAIDLGVGLKIKYYSSSSRQVTIRQVSPKEIRTEGRYKYLVGYCHLRKDERTFKINAILSLEIL